MKITKVTKANKANKINEIKKTKIMRIKRRVNSKIRILIIIFTIKESREKCAST